MAALVEKPRKKPRSRPTKTALVESMLFVISVGLPPIQGFAFAHTVAPPLDVSTCPAVEPFVEIADADTLVEPLKLPLNVPLKAPFKVTPVSVLVTTTDGNCASGTMPVRLAAGTEVNEVLGTAPCNCDAFKLVNPPPLPAKMEFVTKAFKMVAPETRLEASVAVAAVTAVEALVAVVADVALPAVVAVAALPVILMAAVPALRLAGFSAVNPLPLPAKVEFVIKAFEMVAPETRLEASVAVAAVAAVVALVAVMAVVALTAVVALVAVAALPLILMPAVPALRLAGFKAVNPLPLPAKVEFVIKAFEMLAPETRLEASVAVAAVTAVVALVAVVAVVALTAVVALVAVAALPLMLMAAVPAPRLAGFKAVNPLPLPAKVEFVMKAFEMLAPETRLEANIAVAAVAAVVALVAVVALTAVVALVAVAALPLILIAAVPALRLVGFSAVNPLPLPAKVEFVIKAFKMLAPETRLEANIAVVAVAAVVALVAVVAVVAVSADVALVAVAALPLMLMAAVPALRLAGFNALNPLPLPLNVPLRLTPVSVLVKIADDNCVIGMVPETCDAGSLPSKLLAAVAIIA